MVEGAGEGGAQVVEGAGDINLSRAQVWITDVITKLIMYPALRTPPTPLIEQSLLVAMVIMIIYSKMKY